VHRADTEVIDPRLHGGLDLLRRVGGKADQPLGADCLARSRRRRVVLSDVDSVSVQGGGEVGAVIDDQQRAGATNEGAHALAGGEDLLVGPVLDAQLDEVDASAQGAGQKGVRYGIADQIQGGLLEPLAPIAHRISLPGGWAVGGKDGSRRRVGSVTH
jgi:hypothetical protein